MRSVYSLVIEHHKQALKPNVRQSPVAQSPVVASKPAKTITALESSTPVSAVPHNQEQQGNIDEIRTLLRNRGYILKKTLDFSRQSPSEQKSGIFYAIHSAEQTQKNPVIAKYLWNSSNQSLNDKIALLKREQGILNAIFTSGSTSKSSVLETINASTQSHRPIFFPISDHPQIDIQFPFLITESTTGSTLKSVLQQRKEDCTEAEILTVAKQISLALAMTHESGFFHGDIWTGNILVKEESGKIVDAYLFDFSNAASMQETRIRRRSNYFPPDQRDMPYTIQDELWNLGQILLTMATRTEPEQRRWTHDQSLLAMTHASSLIITLTGRRYDRTIAVYHDAKAALDVIGASHY